MPAARPDGLGWSFLSATQLPRATGDVLVQSYLRDALIRLNPEIAARPDLADEVLYRLRAILLSVNADGLVRANEEFTAWLRGERSMPFGPHGEHTPVRLVDFEPGRDNRCLVVTQLVFTAGSQARRFDLVLFVNGIPLVVGEAKTPTRPAVSWLDGAIQVHADCEVNVPAFFVPNVLSFATEGKTYRFGAIRVSLDLWAPWREDDARPSMSSETSQASGLGEVETAVRGLLHPAVILDILRHFTVFATDKGHRKIKIICRFQQYHAANQIVERVVKGRIKKGLIWHFQGSGKSLLIVTSRLLTGFDAPILQAMYLDKPVKEHNLLQGICRVNRPYASKIHGLIVDYIGVFDDVARTLAFDEAAMRRVITNLSVKPPSGNGRLLWHVLGAKTLDLIHENIHVDAVRDDLETLVMDADFLEGLLAGNDPEKAKGIEFRVSARIRRHGNHPRFVSLGKRPEELKHRLEQGVLTSLEYLKQLLVIAREVLQAEREVDPEEERQSAKAALTDLFHETRTEATPAIIERIVNDIDEIVRLVRFPGWQSTSAGEREVRQALRRTLLKYQCTRIRSCLTRRTGTSSSVMIREKSP